MDVAERRTTTAKKAIEILREVTSLEVVSNHLKAKGLKHSASSWDALLNKRILPAIRSNALSVEELLGLLRDSEECGRQHIFLYQCSKTFAKSLINGDRLESAAEELGLSDLLVSAKILHKPTEETFTDIRIESNNKDISFLIIKSVGTHESRKRIGEFVKGNVLNVKYELKKERAVNLVRLSSDGILEIRIGSHSNNSDYKRDLNSLWQRIEKIIPKSNFSEVYLSPLKDKLWNDRDSYSELVRFTNSTLRNDNGTVLQASSGSTKTNLTDDEGATSSLDEFIDHDAYCESSNIWFRPQKDGIPTKDIHVLLSGEINEFAVTAYCSKTNYEYVLSTIRELNSKVSK